MDKYLGVTRQKTNTDNNELPSEKHKSTYVFRAESMFV